MAQKICTLFREFPTVICTDMLWSLPLNSYVRLLWCADKDRVMGKSV